MADEETSAAAERANRTGSRGAAPASPDGRVPPVVGIGASAGGLEAMTKLLGGLPAGSGLALVLVQHLAPDQESQLAELLAPASSLEVVRVTHEAVLAPGRLYVLPPGKAVELRDGRLQLFDRSPAPEFRPVDRFFRSLARELGEAAVGVVLSGMASDGAGGLREIRAAGGTTLVQDPASAKHDGMPRSAIELGTADVVLRPERMGAELVRLLAAPVVGPDAGPGPRGDTEVSDAELARILELVLASTDVDFRQYKPATIRRRIQRRIVLRRSEDAASYVELLEKDPEEARRLYCDVLIQVTRFFREPESFEVLIQRVLPELVARRRPEEALRIWVPGCSSGEEVYSLAMVLLEFLGARSALVPVQIFATDVSEPAIQRARQGTYPEAAVEPVGAERLRRFFTQADGAYRVSSAVRDLCVFARQDVTRDPPFSRMDLIVCRNVLIYLGAGLQRKVVSVFHYALKPGGFLMLGHAETVGTDRELFGLEDKKHKLYRKLQGGRSEHTPFVRPAVLAGPAATRADPDSSSDASILGKVDRELLLRYAPPAVVVSEDLVILQTRGRTDEFLRIAPGIASLHLFKLVRDDLAPAVRAALEQASRSRAPARKEGVRVDRPAGARTVAVQVVPLEVGGGQLHYLVLFEASGAEPLPPVAEDAPERPAAERRVQALESELHATRDNLHAMIQDLEAANEELQSANEEILSSNEELQSTNEELDTAREELQSTNEEINTINEELQARNEELVRVNSDLVNLLASVQIAIVIVSRDLRIRRFTPMAEKVLNLIESDVGRRIEQIRPNFECRNLEGLIREVVDTVTPLERRVQGTGGGSYRLRIRPYKDVDNRIDGAVLALFDDDGPSEGA